MNTQSYDLPTHAYIQCNGVFVEFLYQNGAKLTVSDEKGRGRLHYAALTDDTRYILCVYSTHTHTPAHIRYKHVYGKLTSLGAIG